MDRQSLLAFLLIGIIIVFYPWYMNLVSPIDSDLSTEYVVENKVLDNSTELPSKPKSQLSTTKNTTEPKVFNIKSDLYDLKVSNKNGGSVVSYSLYNFNNHKGELVNLVDDINSDNLLISFVSIDGDKTLLNQKP